LPGHASLFTGVLPSVHGAIDDESPMFEDLSTLAELLHDAGYETAGFISTYLLRGEYGFSRGFDWYDDFSVILGCEMDLFGPGSVWRTVTHGWSATRLVQLVRSWLVRRDTERSLFLFAHFWDIHSRYCPPEPFRSQFLRPNLLPWVNSLSLNMAFYGQHEEEILALYDGEIAFVDKGIEALLDLLKAQGILDNALIVITSDHGEEFSEHGRFDHGMTVYEESVHVPLLLSWNEVLPSGKTCAKVVSTASVTPTILDLLSLPIPESILEPSLKNLILPDTPVSRKIGAPVLSQLWEFDRWLVSARTNEWTVIWDQGDDSWAVYDRQQDLYEQKNIAESLDGQQVLASMKDEIRKSILGTPGSASQNQSQAIPKEIRNALKTIGYVD